MRERHPRESLPLPPFFTFSSPLPASDCRHSWLPSHRLSSCFPSLRPRFVPLPRALCPFSPRASPRPSSPPSAAAFPARFANDERIVSRSSAVVARVSRPSICLAFALARIRSVSLRCPAVATSSLRVSLSSSIRECRRNRRDQTFPRGRICDKNDRDVISYYTLTDSNIGACMVFRTAR